jgi:hypothetical protein
MARADVNEAAKSFESCHDEETIAKHTDSVNSTSLAEYSDGVWILTTI